MQSENASRRRHDAEFKAKVVAACSEPGASIAAVALSHGLNANLVRNWLVGRGLKRAGIAAPEAVPAGARAAPTPALLAPGTRFLPIAMSAPTEAMSCGAAGSAVVAHHSQAVIHVELKRGASSVVVRWPGSAAGECAAWLRELAAAVLK